MRHRYEAPEGHIEHHHLRDDGGDLVERSLGGVGARNAQSDGSFSDFEQRALKRQKVRAGSLLEVLYVERNQRMRLCAVEMRGDSSLLGYKEITTETALFRVLAGEVASETVEYIVNDQVVVLLSVDNTHLVRSGDFE